MWEGFLSCLKLCSARKSSYWSRLPGLQDSVSCTTEGKETPGCQIKGAAKLDTNLEISSLKALLEHFQRAYCWYYNKLNTKKGRVARLSMVLGSLHAFQLLPFLQGTKQERIQYH